MDYNRYDIIRINLMFNLALNRVQTLSTNEPTWIALAQQLSQSCIDELNRWNSCFPKKIVCHVVTSDWLLYIFQ
jgi:hypothetical protein